MNLEQTEIEFVNKARIEKEMERLEDCDVFISKRSGRIVYAKVKPIIPEIRMDFQIVIGELPTDD